ncbi:hypothetical protein HZF05_02940 [Sphingomonas sp. CGMCC 1.13654]|uniref:Uncharacterized protein n=1 Tax=Sphingomonas chungangi TaxID=2683589 RepID=A0A838L4B2_9SPHN|nr:hypothetical protein [Sphingomonas chungangi]MBA2933046.1 hypothetical protein [Sphingomonas chungangi]MVW56666.1 hypothetical protein [Sphingomonas chungangi]
MPEYAIELVSPTSLVLLRPLLAALGATDTALLKPTWSLPAPCFAMPGIRTLVCATPINTLPVFRAAMISVATIEKMDVVIIRHGFAPELLDEVTIDVVAGRTRSVRMLWSLCGYRHGDGSLWLVPPADGAGPSVLLDACGLTITPESPYLDEDDRSDGVTRAARETIRAMRRLRGGR